MLKEVAFKIRRYRQCRKTIQKLEDKICRQRDEIRRLWAENEGRMYDYQFWYRQYLQVSRQLDAIKKRTAAQKED